jgi:tetratricopeptide (TPR) repeat protein
VTADPESAHEERLDGWKRIAAYLNRDVRTVRRREKSQGLPVRRLMHERQATVYAYVSELEAWRERRGQDAAPATRKPAAAGKKGIAWAWAALPVLAIGVLAWWYLSSDRSPATALGEWDWVLITQFENRTGEAVLDGTVEYALQRELANSHHVKVVPRERINDALRLMKLAQDTAIDLETGREISLRDGQIRMLISGRVERLGDTYLISSELVNPSDGVMLASFSQKAEGKDQILPGIGNLALEVRSALGESLASIEDSEAMLAKVTTPSLAALRLYSEASKVMSTDERIRALAILEEAVRNDPDFASAHLLLYYAYGDREDSVRAEAHLRRAVELAEQASERERLFILASYYTFLEDIDKAIETYHLLLRLYPDHYWANGNLSNLYEHQGRIRESLEFRLKVSELRPNSIGWYPDLDILQLSAASGEIETRDAYLAKLMPYSEQAEYGWLMPFMRLLPVHQAWIDGRYGAAYDALENLVANLDREAMVRDGWLFAHIRSIYLALGKLERFRELSAMRDRVGWFEALLDLDSGSPETLDRYLQASGAAYWNAVLMAAAGQAESARSIIDDPRAEEEIQFLAARSAWKDIVRGQIAASEGRLEDAVSILGEESPILNISYKWAHLFAMHSLATAYEDLGSKEQAIETLEQARLQKPLTIFETGGTYMWQRNQLYLYRLYLAAGRKTDAEATAAELRSVLQLADPGHPLLAALDSGID